MQTLRDIFVALGIVFALDLTTRAFLRIVYGPLYALFGNDLDVAGWAMRICTFLFAIAAGFLLMRLVTWKWRAPVTVALAVAYPIGALIWWYGEMPDYGVNPDFAQVVQMGMRMIEPTLGLIAGVVAWKFMARRDVAGVSPAPNTSLERTREG